MGNNKNFNDGCCSNDACCYDMPVTLRDGDVCCESDNRCACGDSCECGVGATHIVGLLLFGAGIFAVGYLVGNQQAREKTFEAVLQAKKAAVTHYPQVQDKVVSLLNEARSRYQG